MLTFFRIRKIILFSLLSTFALAQDSFAPSIQNSGSKIIFENQNYLYYRTPYYRFNAKKSRDLRKQLFLKMGHLIEKNQDLIFSKKKSSSNGVLTREARIELASNFNQNTESLLKGLHLGFVQDKFLTLGESGYLPSAFIFVFGGKNLILSLGKESGIQIAAIVVPTQYTYINKLSGKITVRDRIEVSFQLISIVSPTHLTIGSRSSVYDQIGAGYIWGDLDCPEDFVGPIASVSTTFTVMDLSKQFNLPSLGSFFKEANINIKAGILKQWDSPTTLPNAKTNAFAFVTLLTPTQFSTKTVSAAGVSTSIETLTEQFAIINSSALSFEENPRNYKKGYDLPTDLLESHYLK